MYHTCLAIERPLSSNLQFIHQIALRFPTRFWADRTKDADCIGHVPSSEETRGLFAVFYDMSPKV